MVHVDSRGTSGELSSAKQPAQDRFKASFCCYLCQGFASAPGREHADQQQQANEDSHAYSQVDKNLLKPAGGQRDPDEWSGEQKQDEQEAAAPAQPGSSSPGPPYGVWPHAIYHVAGGQAGQEKIILSLSRGLRVRCWRTRR